ncbi:iron-containing alcohol dehydrogenase family protein [Terrilactibacillus laevilacticus]|uniref:Iron-containing alcohol dehydrogenase family protein n=1 Tax=Terrilactibacillus laevilacticus TaxID=1380157 RepID=A0ABW5PM72_9BACI|nr:iron-containing alcohol dehydrogenase family protein [Terrilactibacillus laevilacticus]
MKMSEHQISIPTILEVGKGTLNDIGPLLQKSGFSSIVIFFGEGLMNLLGSKVFDSLNKVHIDVLHQQEVTNIDMNHIVNQAFSLPQQTQAIVGIGGGKALDAAKYMALLKKVPFISIPTSTSNDGFSSSNASLTIGGKRVSVSAKMPYGIIVDIDVIKKAPVMFIHSGVGDLISKITALYDWVYEEQHEKGQVDAVALMLSKKAVNSFARTTFENVKDDFFLKELVDSLIMSGIAMEIAGSSAPSSGSEHLISHALDKISEKPQLHGIQVGIATYIMSKVQNHRFERVSRVLTETGFFNYAKTLGMKRSDFEKAIDQAPNIKPSRYTYLHHPPYQEEARKVLHDDKILKDILVQD